MITTDPILLALLATQHQLAAARDMLAPLDPERTAYADAAMEIARLVGRRVHVLAQRGDHTQAVA